MEEWKGIPTLPDFQASSLGRIRRVHHRKNSGDSGLITQRPISSGVGYLVVSLSFRGKTSTKLVHRLVAEAFLGVCPKGKEVNHRDSNKGNNTKDNLEYVTRSENLIHSGAYRGERNSNSKLTEARVRHIRQLHNEGLGYKRLAKHFGLPWSLVRSVASGKTWKHVI